MGDGTELKPRYMPFLERFREPIMERRKTKTARTRPYGRAGDVVKTPFGLVRLTDVSLTTLGDVAYLHYPQEGVESPAQFIAIWKSIHTHRGFDPDEVVYLHTFELIS